MKEQVFENCMKKMLRDQVMSRTKPVVKQYQLAYNSLLCQKTNDIPCFDERRVNKVWTFYQEQSLSNRAHHDLFK